MSLDDDINAFLVTAEQRPAASKLEPYAELIRTLRQRRWTFVEIAAALRDRFGLNVAPSTIHNFIKVRAKRKPVIDAPTHNRTPESPTAQPTTTKRPRFHLDT